MNQKTEEKAAKHFKMWELILVFILVVACLAEGYLLIRQHTGNKILVTKDGEEIAEYYLNKNGQYRIETEEGYNLLIIQGGEAWVSEADCESQVCVSMGKISKAGQLIVCLPHGIVIEVQE